MDDLNGALAGILNDSASMEKIKQLASGLMQEKKTQPIENPLGNIMNDAQSMSKILKVMSAMNNSEIDRRSELLMALKPHLSPERRDRIDTAVKILRLLSIAPLLKDSGILF